MAMGQIFIQWHPMVKAVIVVLDIAAIPHRVPDKRIRDAVCDILI